MKSKLFKSVSVLLAVIMAFGFTAVVSASDASAKLYQTYGDQMLFQQNKPVVIAGTATPGSLITCELVLSGQTLHSSSAQTASDGTFMVTLSGSNGGYDEYSILCRCNGTLFDTLDKVVFGELWIASGQSNMQLPMAQSLEGADMVANGKIGTYNVRYLNVPGQPVYNGLSNNIPLKPQNDVNGASWCNGTEIGVYSSSAVGFFFAEKLQKQLNVPVGLITLPLGGSSIYTWLSRDAIEGNAQVLADTKDAGVYYSASKWNESQQNTFGDITCNYNNKLYAMHNFRPAGMIWYQGESNVSLPYGYYSRAFDLMQTSYSDLFGFEDGALLPIVYTQLATYHYGDDKTALPRMNMQFAEMQAARPQYRALTSIYDVGLDYTPEVHAIHPLRKLPVGERMAYSAMGLVYDSFDTYTTPHIKSFDIHDGAVYVTLNHVGDGLVVKQSGKYAKQDPIYGCTVCGENGIFVEADAEIVSSDTVRIHSDSVPSPVAATYAYSETNVTANLFSSVGGDPVFGVSPFTTELFDDAKYLQTLDWTNFEIQSRWHSNENIYSGEFPTWGNSMNSEMTYNETDAYKGTACLRLDAVNSQFGVCPTMTFEKDSLYETFLDVDTDYSRFNTVSFMVNNKGANDVTFDALKMYISSKLWFAPTVDGTDSTDCLIPADGQWHRVTLDLDKLYLYGRDNGLKGSRADLKDIYSIELLFNGSTANSTVLLDDFVFTPADSTAHFNIFNFGSWVRLVFPAVQFFFDIFAPIDSFFDSL